MFFLPRTRPLELTARGVRALRPSLNTPVVATSDLPVGPACAAILVHVEPGQGLQISVGVRSLGCGSVALYGFEGPIGASVVNVALDAALSFAESMGFLFDDDVVDDDEASREKAVLRWQELIGDPFHANASSFGEEPAPGDLFESAGGELTDSPEPDKAGGERRQAAGAAFELGQPDLTGEDDLEFRSPAPGSAVTLTKFRVQPEQGALQPAEPDAPETPARRASRKRALGRMRLIKRRGSEPDQSPEPAEGRRRAWLLKLLTSV